MSTKTLMTVEEFAQLNFEDHEAFELVEGELIALSSGTPVHARICLKIARRLGEYFERHASGEAFPELDCALSSNTVRRPDLSVFLAERAAQLDVTRVPAPFAPDIAVEVISPSESAVQVNRKSLDYLRAGSREVWLLDHENGEVFVQTGSGISLLRGSEPLTSPLLPGFSVTVDELFG